jgi:hypothetical protein
MKRDEIGKDRMAALQVALLQTLPKGGLHKRLLAVVAIAPTKRNGSCAWPIIRLAASAETRPDRASVALRELRRAGFLKLRLRSGRIVEIWLSLQIGEPRDARERATARRNALRPEFAALVSAAVRRTIKRGDVRFDLKAVIDLAVSLKAGRTMKRSVLAAELGLSISQCCQFVKAETVRNRHGKPLGVRIEPTEIRRVENLKIGAPKTGGSTRGRAHSPRTTGSVCGEIEMSGQIKKGLTNPARSEVAKPALRVVGGRDMIDQGKKISESASTMPDSVPPETSEPTHRAINDEADQATGQPIGNRSLPVEPFSMTGQVCAACTDADVDAAQRWRTRHARV